MYKDFPYEGGEDQGSFEERRRRSEGRKDGNVSRGRTDERARVCVTDGRTVGLRIWHGMQDVSMALAVVVSQ